MSKPGRNSPCSCGSGKKFKHCCGALDARTVTDHLPPHLLSQLQLAAKRQEAREYRRRLMQGLGKPIISAEINGYRLVAVGDRIRWSQKWFTFTDFLFDYIKAVFGLEWGQSELAKPEPEQHPILDWMRRIDVLKSEHAKTQQGLIYNAPMTGVVRALLGLAYDLYLSAHNAELPALLVKRLRNRNTFEGALYEASVIGTFAKAGFAIEFEDESDPTVSHCEFTATHKVTRRKFSVEAKSVSSASSRAGQTSNPPRIRNQLYSALRKRAVYPRIIFIELNRSQVMMANGEPDWVAPLDQELAAAESELTIDGAPAPPAYLFVTNRAFLHALDAPDCGEAGIAHGFKITEFPQGRGCASMLEAVEARERHIEAHWLLKAMGSRAEIPSTFDDRTPEEAFAAELPPPLRIGDTYMIPDELGREVPGVLYEATIADNEGCAYGAYQLSDGRSIIGPVPLSKAEMEIYRRSPETFFGVVKHVSKGITQPMDAYDFLHETYSKSPKGKLLEFMADWPDVEAMRSLSQNELAKRYCARMAEGMWEQFGPNSTPLAPTVT